MSRPPHSPLDAAAHAISPAVEPTPPEEWTWTTSTFIACEETKYSTETGIGAYPSLADWMSDLVQGSTWSAVASLFSLGLTWWEGLLAIFSVSFDTLVYSGYLCPSDS